MSDNKRAIQRLKQYFGSQLDDDSIAAVLAVCEGDVNRAITFLQGDGSAPAYDVRNLAQNSDAIPDDYPRLSHSKGGQKKQPEKAASKRDLVSQARALFTNADVSYRQHYDFQREHYATYAGVLLLLLHEGVEVQRACRPRVIAAAWARHDYQLVDFLTTKYDELFQLPQVLAALELLDARRQSAALRRKLESYSPRAQNSARTGALRDRLAELAREEHIGSLTNSVVKHAKRWVRRISPESLIFYALTLPKEPWKRLADLLHLSPTDFASITLAHQPEAAAAAAAEAGESKDKKEGKKKQKEKKKKRGKEALKDTFLGYVFDSTTAGRESMLYKCQHVNSANVVSLVQQYRVPYSFLRTRVKPLPDAAKPLVARSVPLDTLIWYHEELACEAVNDVLRQRLEAGERPTLGYGKLMERMMYFEAQQLPFAEMLLPTAEESLRAIQLALEPPVYCFGDASYSMDVAIRCSTIIGSVLASLTSAELRFFNDRVIQLPRTPRTTREVMDAVKQVRADGLTAPACALWPMYRSRTPAKFLIMVTDEVENVKSEGEYWPTLYARYVREVAPECTAVFVSFLGGGSEKGRMVAALEALGIKNIIQFRLEGSRPDLTRLDSILGLLAAESKQFPQQVRVLTDAFDKGGLAAVVERLKTPLIQRAEQAPPAAAVEEAAAPAPEKPAPAQEPAEKQKKIAKDPLRESDGMDMCLVCMEAPATVAMLPCGHMCCCEGCGKGMKTCPVCRTLVTSAQRIYIAGVQHHRT